MMRIDQKVISLPHAQKKKEVPCDQFASMKLIGVITFFRARSLFQRKFAPECFFPSSTFSIFAVVATKIRFQPKERSQSWCWKTWVLFSAKDVSSDDCCQVRIVWMSWWFCWYKLKPLNMRRYIGNTITKTGREFNIHKGALSICTWVWI